MKKNILRAALTTTMLLSMVSGQNVITNAAAVTPVTASTPSATAKPAATPAPIMRDNLSKYGLKKDLELPVTVTAGGLSYTLEKFMIYDFKSKDAQNLVKQFKYDSFGVMVSNPKYLVWTKIIIKNNSKSIVKRALYDQKDKWVLSLKDGGELDPIWPKVNEEKINNKSAFYYYTLKPGEQLSTYQAFLYEKDFDYFAIRMYHAGGFDEKLIVNY
ncbi:hypothetical protein BSK62_12955 [Paenibacillus odorifer]|uniref:hypothetical protein n=1 Tax=Paenibacillus TaxID=44249 RepID=UPI00096BE64F|nr:MULTISPECIES: hypothetical protein [Paenibacillus]MDH6425613.1 hypothetical protein [Paenibacillus sp. PastH-4]MDH6441633.1 hypothetical protein [Paenibacillus sp. PastF-4]MDH6529856.1 hypothetical protein [Paenibacillus sp. PastH-3]OMD65971.1 hypothetical protein BSK62_12955 [Paenibacillus odorifer]